MVKIVCKMSAIGTVELELAKAEKLSRVQELLTEQIGVPLGGVIAVRQGSAVGPDDLVLPDDELVFFPAISGG